MFEIHGDEIVLEGVKVGRLEGGWPTLRDRAECLLLYGGTAQQLDEEYQRGYDAALKDTWVKR